MIDGIQQGLTAELTGDGWNVVLLDGLPPAELEGLKAAGIALEEECCTHQAPDGTTRVFRAERISQYMEQNGFDTATIALDPAFAAQALKAGRVEQYRLDRLIGSYLRRPIVHCCLDDGSRVLIDGHHRYVRLCQLGVFQADTFLVPPIIMASISASYFQ